ncbi:MAG: outer membrane beta-barrel protein [Francisellaceae bacterium]|jgi:opacity protein-like surface antigen|nr:outer membrane beta-barrel protein [Francisellaceae bacterium]MBT6539148.1 outer membrane beta-barrel protein [Francisellaceae bacterium]
MYLKNSLKLALLLSSVAGLANANDYGLKFQPYLGVDIQSAKWGFEDTYGKGHIPKSAKQGHVYFGVQVHDYLALELGYEASQKKTNTMSLAVGGANVVGAVVTADQADSNNHFSISQQAVNFDLVPQIKIPGHEEITVFGVVGVSIENINAGLSLTTLPDGTGADTRKSQISQKNKNILRLGAGAKYQFSDNAGVKVSAVWKKWGGYNNMTGAAEVYHGRSFDALTARMRNGYQFGLGVYAAI